jgi:hypothetical protein
MVDYALLCQKKYLGRSTEVDWSLGAACAISQIPKVQRSNGSVLNDEAVRQIKRFMSENPRLVFQQSLKITEAEEDAWKNDLINVRIGFFDWFRQSPIFSQDNSFIDWVEVNIKDQEWRLIFKHLYLMGAQGCFVSVNVDRNLYKMNRFQALQTALVDYFSGSK